MIFIELTPFAEKREKYLDDEGFRALQNEIMQSPEKGALIKGSGGLRKIRVKGLGRGKRGGCRVIYYYAPSYQIVYLLAIYAKNEKDDLTPKELREIRSLLKDAINDAQRHAICRPGYGDQ